MNNETFWILFWALFFLTILFGLHEYNMQNEIAALMDSLNKCRSIK